MSGFEPRSKPVFYGLPMLSPGSQQLCESAPSVQGAGAVDTAGWPPLVACLASEVNNRALSPPGVARLDDHNPAFNSSCELRKARGHLWSVTCHWTHRSLGKEDGSSLPFLLLHGSQVCKGYDWSRSKVLWMVSDWTELGLDCMLVS